MHDNSGENAYSYRVEQHEDRTSAAASGSDILARFNLLERSGALGDLEALRKENRELDQLITDASALVALSSVPRMLDFVIEKVLEHFVPEFLGFVIEPPRGMRLSQFCYRNLRLTDEVVPLDSYHRLKAHFLEKPYAARYEAIAQELGFDHALDPFNPEVIFPMRGIGGLYGIVLLGHKVVGADYSDFEAMYVDRLTRFLSVGLQNGLHHLSSITDSKTGLYNHEYFVRRLEEELARESRQGNRACVMMLDVDHFKHFNDTYGHLLGDSALESLASTLKSAMRASDAVARFGGEEFCVLAVDCDEYRAMDIAERIRSSVEAMDIPNGAGSLHITVSIGIRMLEPGIGTQANVVLDEADKALYASKAAGRNRCTMFRPGLLGRASLLRIIATGADTSR